MVSIIARHAFHTCYESEFEGWIAVTSDKKVAKQAALLSSHSTSSFESTEIMKKLGPYQCLQLVSSWPSVSFAGKCRSPFLSRMAAFFEQQHQRTHLLSFFFSIYSYEAFCDYLDTESWPHEHPFCIDCYNLSIAGGAKGEAKYPPTDRASLFLYYAARMKQDRLHDFDKTDFLKLKEFIQNSTGDIDIRRKMWELLFDIHTRTTQKEKQSPFINEVVSIISSDDEMSDLTPMYIAFLSYAHKISWETARCPFSRIAIICHKMRMRKSTIAALNNWWDDPISRMWAMKVEDLLYPTTLISKAFMDALEVANPPRSFWLATFRYLAEVAVGKIAPPQKIPSPLDSLLETKQDFRILLKQAFSNKDDTKSPDAGELERAALSAKKLIAQDHIDELVDFLFDQKPIATMEPWIELNRAFEYALDAAHPQTQEIP